MRREPADKIDRVRVRTDGYRRVRECRLQVLRARKRDEAQRRAAEHGADRADLRTLRELVQKHILLCDADAQKRGV